MYRKDEGVRDPSPEELQRLTGYIAQQCPAPEYRPTLAQDALKLIRLHRQHHCRWFHNGQILVHGPGFEPEKWLRENGR